jgi:hypothetical protein
VISSTAITSRVIRALNLAGIPHMLVGAFSRNAYAPPRSTQDADVVVALAGQSLRSVAETLGADFSLDRHRKTSSSPSSAGRAPRIWTTSGTSSDSWSPPSSIGTIFTAGRPSTARASPSMPSAAASRRSSEAIMLIATGTREDGHDLAHSERHQWR